MHTVKRVVAIAALSLAPAVVNAAPKAIVLAADQWPAVVQEETAPIQPFYQTVLPPAYVDDARGG